MTRTRLAVLLVFWAGVAVLAGCGGQNTNRNRVQGSRLTIYASVPMNGPSGVSGDAVVNGAQLALDQIHARIGQYRIVFRALDDSTPTSGEWDPGQTTVNARLATRDGTTIGYLGEFNSGASAVSIPVLNRLSIPQISPASTAVGLTSSGPGASPGEPQKYYPSGIRTFARVIPNDVVQARVQVKLQRRARCTSTFVVDDGEFDGEEMATSFQLAARAGKLPVLGVQQFPARAPDYRAFAAGVASTHAGCVLISAIPDSGAVAVTRQIAQAMPSARIFLSDGLAESTFADPRRGGLPAGMDSRVMLTAATLGPGALPPAARVFYADYQRRYGAPELSAIYGYEAMSVLLSAIARATDGGSEPALRSKVLAALLSTRADASVLGSYRIDGSGDTSIRRYGVYRLRNGHLEFWKAMDG